MKKREPTNQVASRGGGVRRGLLIDYASVCVILLMINMIITRIMSDRKDFTVIST